MEIRKILEADVLDIIFEQKNKTYGAYELRKNYHKRAKKAMMAMVLFGALVSSIPLVAGLLTGKERIARPPSITTVLRDIKTDPPPRINPPIKPHVTKPQTNTEIVKHTVPKIIRSEEVKDIDKMHKNDEIKDKTTGIVAQKGDEGNDTPNLQPPGDGKGNIDDAIVEVKPPIEKTFSAIELTQDPEFPGGEDEMVAFLKKHLRYPNRAREDGVNGKVVIDFVIDKEGKISEIKVLRKAGYGFDDEATRVLGMMPNWRPGKINGQTVKAHYNIPIVFQLADE